MLNTDIWLNRVFQHPENIAMYGFCCFMVCALVLVLTSYRREP